MSEEVINVNLYGGKGLFGGREKPLEAVVTKCDMYDQCSFFKGGHCMNIPDINMKGCKHGNNEVIKGYTSRAQKYGAFRSKWKNHEKYSRLSQPKKKVGQIADEVVLSMSFLNMERIPNSARWHFKALNMFSNDSTFIPYETFNSELIKNICEHRPQAVMGGTITEYQKEEVPLFLAHLKEVLPEKYDAFVKAYPAYDKAIDHTGRKAYLHSLKPCNVKYVSSRSQLNEEWTWDGKYLTLLSNISLTLFITDKYAISQLVIKPEEDTVITITENEQVDEDTVFIN